MTAGHLYEAFSTPAEVEARHRAAGRDPKRGYDNFDRDLTDDQRAAYRAEGREPVLRLRMPAEDLSWTDLVRGPVTFAAGVDPDFVVARSNGEPLYTLVNPVDDALMKITHVLRGEDLLPSTPRQIALYRALIDIGVTDYVPQFGHLPYVMGSGNKKLSKRDPEGSFETYRDAGYIPEGLINYLALLGWAIADDHDIFSPAEMVAAFDIADVNANPARFDLKKCEAINAAHLRLLDAADFAQRLADQVDAERGRAGLAGLDAGARVLVERGRAAGAGADPDVGRGRGHDRLPARRRTSSIEEKAAAKHLGPDGQAVLVAAIDALSGVADWSVTAIEAALRIALIEKLELKPRVAFGPIRVAITGSAISPPLFESLELLGPDVTRRRLQAAVATA